MERAEEVTSAILQTLAKQQNTMSIVELTQQTGIHRNVLAKYIKVLEAQGKIEISRIGAKKYLQLSQRISASVLKKFVSGSLILFDKFLEIAETSDDIVQFDMQNPTQKETGIPIDIIEQYFLTEQVKNSLLSAITGQRSEHRIEIPSSPEPHYYHVTIAPVVLDNGRPGAGLIIDDITSTETIKRKFDNLSSAYCELIESQIQFIVRINQKFEICSVNSVFCRHAGVDEESIIGTSFIPIYPKDIYDSSLKALSSIHPDNQEISLELRRINGNGDFAWEKWNIRGLYNEESETISEYLATGLDITELKRNEQELQHYKDNFESLIQDRTNELREVNSELHKEIYRREIVERELRLIKFAMDNAKDLIFLLNSAGDIQYMNVIAQEMTGISNCEDLNIRKIIRTNNSEIENPFTFSFEEVINFGLLTIKGFVQSIQGNSIPVEITISQIVEQGETIFCCVARDITDRNKIERDLYHYRKHLEEIIEERTKRLQIEVDSKNYFETSFKNIEERFALFADYSPEIVLIYDKDTKKYIDINKHGEIFFQVNRETLRETIPEQLSNVILDNDTSLQLFVEEKEQELSPNQEWSGRHQISFDLEDHRLEVMLHLRAITIQYHRYIRIGITRIL